MTFELNDKMITDRYNRIAWTFGYLKENKNLLNLIEHLYEEDDKIRTMDSFHRSRDYIANNYPELLL